MKKSKLYCKECGKEMIKTLEPAEGWVSVSSSYTLNSKYDEVTGKRQYLTVFTCPKYYVNKENKHYIKVIHKIILQDEKI